MKVKLILVDDHAMFRSGLHHALLLRPNLEVLGEASTGESALTLVKELKPDLVLMDVHLPDMNGIEASRRILNDHPSIKIIIFSGDTIRASVDEALQVGVCGYLSKAGPVDELNLAIDSVMAGKLYLSSEVSGDILNNYRESLQDSRKGLLEDTSVTRSFLSEREEQLLRLIAAGRRNKEISAELNISIKSVEAYRARLMKKLGCSNIAELVRYAVRQGITEA
jgi:DNA-binding NarL/FixJ family response regulator